ncbi:cytochrome c oxidase accessory protein CcoG [Acidihalobacter prosperus]|uniref:Cytochrome c oxidase accessory protein CcoG n=1 Tax=Acidihalobacter prosperus TaxID=160660 RepID=A0A1A6C0W9_9GAMM|nr:cytochrome c oxidase accessory protein CcoG [Acidihalobacter prosperus]OBS08198.1 cytochrome c oxidase accessory protein CcoG [Acidihalobacter prosperus]
MNDHATQPYQSRIAIYPRTVKGRFRGIKYAILILAYGVFFLLPWLRWTRVAGPHQAVLFDLPERHFYLFDLVVFPQNIFWLAILLVIAALLLFFVTGVAGRVWCGYFCFQTLWTDVYLLIERWIQGERPARMRLREHGWTGERVLKLGLTHALWLAVAFWTGLTFTLYWADAPGLALSFFQLQAPFAAYATTFLLMATTYIFAGLAREQVCTYMCPYARFQSVMFDRDTLIVSYDRSRGEGEGGRRKVTRELKSREARQAAGHGDCIDCGYCVQVCPTGIDIRNGLQVECIHCALCVDACNGIMRNLGWPSGLIRYTSERALAGGRTRFLKLKTVGYGLALTAAVVLLIGSVATRAAFDASVQQTRQPLTVTLSDGSIQNGYAIVVNNTSTQRLTLRVGIQGLAGARLEVQPGAEMILAPEASRTVYVKLRYAAKASDPKRIPFSFRLTPEGRGAPAALLLPTQFYTR